MPFCQQITSPSLSDELLKFFSETYEQEIGIVEQIFSQYLDTSEMVLNAIQFISSQNIPFLEIDLFKQKLKYSMSVWSGTKVSYKGNCQNRA